MVVSGPNYGRNSTALFSLSSGTVGGAMEGALCGKRSVALSYAFFNRNHDPVIIRSASLMSVRLIKYLHANWTPGVDLYAINVPLLEGIDKPERKILYTHILQNRWVTGCSFEELEDDEADKSDTGRREAEIRGDVGEHEHKHLALKHKKFIWAPKFADIHRSVEESGPGNDGWAVAKGYVSITPLKANFMHYDGLVGQELNM
jgi:5'/3'-nucleotidase SurE